MEEEAEEEEEEGRKSRRKRKKKEEEPRPGLNPVPRALLESFGAIWRSCRSSLEPRLWRKAGGGEGGREGGREGRRQEAPYTSGSSFQLQAAGLPQHLEHDPPAW